MENTPDTSAVCTSSGNNLKLVTYNCKNAETSKYAIEELSRLSDVVLLQEQWYFDCQLANLTTICDSLTGSGKVVDRRSNTACADAKGIRGSGNIMEEND